MTEGGSGRGSAHVKSWAGACIVAVLGLLSCQPTEAAAQSVKPASSKTQTTASDTRLRPDSPFWFPHMPSSSYGLYLGGGGLALKPSLLDQLGMGNPTGFVLGLYGVGWRFFSAELGFGGLWAPDRRSFLETACEIASNACRTDGSTVGGLMAWIKAGAQVRWFLPIERDALEISALGGLGARGLDLTRKASHGGPCTDCATVHLAVDGGPFVSPEVTVAYAFGKEADSGAVGVKLTYERYLSGDILEGVWISAFLEGYEW